ncbi:MAG: replication-relaxation family protein [Fimbriimonadaceae bacterium]|nr:replication-relaxation family protein [Fimbriimonadaceae bacterium]
MRITHRDFRLLRDLLLSHVLARDQILELGYFGSLTRANTRLRELCHAGLARRLPVPYYRQSLYSGTKRAAELMDRNIARLVEGRSATPRFIQHSLATTSVRVALCRRTSAEWRFEQQLWRKLPALGVEVRPDGLLITSTRTFIEIDLGHASANKYKEKLESYGVLARSGLCGELYGFESFRLLTVTTGALRARHLRQLQPYEAGFDHLVQTFEECGATQIHSWS